MAALSAESRETVGEDKGTDASAKRPPTPRWVKMFGVIGIIVLVLIIVILVANAMGFGAEHGPWRHGR